MVQVNETLTSSLTEKPEGNKKRLAMSYDGVRWFAAVFEATTIVVASILAGAAYHVAVYSSSPDVDVLLGIGVLAAAFHVSICATFGFYQLLVLLEPSRYLRQVASVWIVSTLLLTLVLFLLKIGATYSRGSVICILLLAILGIVGQRAVLGRYLRDALNRGTLAGRRAMIAGEADELQAINPREMFAHFGIMEVGRVTFSNEGTALNVAEIDRLLDLSRSRSADEIVLALSWKADERLESARHRLRVSALPVRLLPDRNVQSLLGLSGRSRHSFVIDLQRQPLRWVERAAKRTFDVIGASFLLMMLVPLFLAVVIAIKLDSPGPAIFRQRRKGFNGKPFLIYKFRTMLVLEDGPVVRQAQKNDRRVTRVGRVLRRTSIDELPQLINVLKGEMSLIGPRPHAVAHDDEYGDAIAGYAARHHMKPGITGWAQINGFRGEASSIKSMEQRVEHDLWYINNWSFWLDVRILLKSGLTLFGDPAAY